MTGGREAGEGLTSVISGRLDSRAIPRRPLVRPDVPRVSRILLEHSYLPCVYRLKHSTTIAVFTRMYGTWGWEAPVQQRKLDWSPYVCSETALGSGDEGALIGLLLWVRC